MPSELRVAVERGSLSRSAAVRESGVGTAPSSLRVAEAESGAALDVAAGACAKTGRLKGRVRAASRRKAREVRIATLYARSGCAGMGWEAADPLRG